MTRSQPPKERARSPVRMGSASRDRSPSRTDRRTKGSAERRFGTFLDEVYLANEVEFHDVLSSLKRPSCVKERFKLCMANAMIRQGGVFGTSPSDLSFITYGALASSESATLLNEDNPEEEENTAADSGAKKTASDASSKKNGTNNKDARNKKDVDMNDSFFICDMEIPYEDLSVKAKGTNAKKNLASLVKGGAIYGGSKSEYGYISYL